MIRLIIFDLDGTLLYTLDDLAAACNFALVEHQLSTHSLDDYRYFVGNGVHKLIERILPPARQADAALLERVHASFDQYYAAHSTDLTHPYKGIPALLDALRDREIRLAVLSNKPHPFTRSLVERYFPGRFSPVYGKREGYPVKPDGRLTAELLAETGMRPHEVLYVGDSGVDMQTAQNGGLLGVGVLWGFREREELLSSGAGALIAHPLELLELLQETS